MVQFCVIPDSLYSEIYVENDASALIRTCVPIVLKTAPYKSILKVMGILLRTASAHRLTMRRNCCTDGLC